MAQVENPRKEFAFSIQFIPSVANPFLFQEVEIPDSEIDVVEHGDTNHDIKTGGRRKIGTLKCKKLLTTDGSDTTLWDWHCSIQDLIAGGGLPPQQYKRQAIVTELAEDGATVLNSWVATGIWPSKINGQKHDRRKSDNTIEEVDFAVDGLEKV